MRWEQELGRTFFARKGFPWCHDLRDRRGRKVKDTRKLVRQGKLGLKLAQLVLPRTVAGKHHEENRGPGKKASGGLEEDKAHIPYTRGLHSIKERC